MRYAVFLSLAVILGTSSVAQAEIVFFPSGRILSVSAIRSQGDELVLKLRSGGEITCAKELIAKVEPDEIEYPDEVMASLPAARAMMEPPTGSATSLPLPRPGMGWTRALFTRSSRSNPPITPRRSLPKGPAG